MDRLISVAAFLAIAIGFASPASAGADGTHRVAEVIPSAPAPDGPSAWVKYRPGGILRNDAVAPDEQEFRLFALPRRRSAAEGDRARPDVSRKATDVAPDLSWSPVWAPPQVSIPPWMVKSPPAISYNGSDLAGCPQRAYRPTWFLRPDVELRRAGLYPAMSRAACEFGVPVPLFDALIIQESRYRHDATSAKNAYGLAQLMPGTAAALGIDRYDSLENLRGGAKYLRQQLDRLGYYHLALAAYNAGPGRVRGGTIPRIAETQGYVASVLRNWSRLAGLDPITPAVSPPRANRLPAARTAFVTTF